jgi:AcrR family transcriptional regulator
MNANAMVTAVDGRSLKRKGANTRQRILHALEQTLGGTPTADLRVAHIAAAADVAMPTFYSYFPSLDDALLALVSEKKFAYAEVLDLIHAPWPKGAVADCARAFARAYFQFWDRHRAVLRLRNMKGDEGDVRFLAVRLDHTLPILEAVAEKLAVAKAEGLMPLHVPATSFAAVIMAALERNGATYIHVTRHRREDLVEASAMTLAMWLGAPAADQAL